MNLNPQQKLAVEHLDGPLLILAGAGSGKTRVLTERIVHLIKQKYALPYQILAVTFTNKAASEMKARVVERIGTSANEVWLSTFHSACVKILRHHIEKIGINSHFAIIDDSDQLSAIKKILVDLNISEKLLTPRSALEKISRAKDQLIGCNDYPSGDFFNSKVAKVYKKYDDTLRQSGVLDFGDLIALTIKLFRSSPETLAYYQDRFRYIMVDEYQDTNHAQYQFIRLLAAKYSNIAVVGDPDQSIYAWRGADISNILEFERDFPGAKVIKLEQNYRSTKNILAASDALIANNSSRKPKKLWTENEHGEPINLIETTDEKEEARLVVKEIKRLTDEGVSLNDMAIFYRTNAQSRIFEDGLRTNGIPYVIYGGIRFYDRAEIKNTIAYLRLINNPNDDLSLKRIINIPLRAIGKTTVEKLVHYAAASNTSIYNYINSNIQTSDFNSGTKTKLIGFAKLINELISFGTLPLPDMVLKTVDKIGYIEALKRENTDEAFERIANIDELVSAVSEAHKNNPQITLADFLDQVTLVSDIDSYEEGSALLPLMTMHIAKGLEFDSVFIVGLEEGLCPHIRSLDEPKELEEERRLFYVGMTRARKMLYLCHANERMVRGNYSYNVPSRFLDEIPKEYVKRTVTDAKAFKILKRDFIEKQISDSGFSQISGYDDFFEDDTSKYRVGQRVRHPTFGDGIIRQAEGPSNQQRLLVQFKSGELKKLSAQHANLSLIS